MISILQKRLNRRLYEYRNYADYDIVYEYYENKHRDKYIRRRRTEYKIPIIKMIANKLSTTMINSNLITESEIFKIKPFKQFVAQYFGTGWSLISWCDDDQELRVFDWDKIIVGEDVVIGWQPRINGSRYIEIHEPSQVTYLVLHDGNIIEEIVHQITAPQYILMRERPIWKELTSQIKSVAVVYNNFMRDMYLGGKKVMIDRSLMRIDPATGEPISPDDVAQELFSLVEPDMREKADRLFYEYNPDLRVQDNIESLSYHIGLLTSALGLGNNFIVDNRTSYAFNSTVAWSTSNQEQVDTVATYSMIFKELFEQWLSALELKDITISMNYDFIIDRSEERKNDIQDIQLGIMSKAEYRVKWYGESIEEATKNVPAPDLLTGAF